MKRYKRLPIFISISAGVIVTFVVLMFTLFGLKNVDMEFQNNTKLFAEQSKISSIISDAEFKKNSCVLFLNKDKYIAKMEKNNPYLKVINIETIFPNKLIIHCAEREEIFAIKNGDKKYFICDDDFKVLKILDYSNTDPSDDYSSTQNNAILLNGINVLNSSATVGDFLQISEGQAIIYNLVSSTLMNNRDFGETKAFYKQIDLTYNVLGQAKLGIYIHSGYKVEILDAEKLLANKLNVLFSIYDKIPATEYNSHKLIIFFNEEQHICNGHHTKIV